MKNHYDEKTPLWLLVGPKDHNAYAFMWFAGLTLLGLVLWFLLS